VISEAVIFKDKYVIEDFNTPADPAPRFYFGADFGYGPDPACLMRSYITGEEPFQELWVDYEAFGHGVEQDDLPKLYDAVPGSRRWPIKADCSRPETISHLRRKGFQISGAKKWDGSVEDGIYHLRQFTRIHVHPRCKNFAVECRMYRRKIDKVTGQVLPVIVDSFNHGWDGIRYGFDGFIKNRGMARVWENL
jgi:phage terminase large subunit